MSRAEVEDKLLLGPGWMERYETGQTIPGINSLLAIVEAIGSDYEELFEDLPPPSGSAANHLERYVNARQDGQDLIVSFPYGEHEAEVRLANATLAEFDCVLKAIRDGLARLDRGQSAADQESIKTDAVAHAFLTAVRQWPMANPSDLWYFLVYRAYLDPYNHPADFARLDLAQSWRRTSGWALEKVVMLHYAPFLAKHGIRLIRPTREEAERLLSQASNVTVRLEADKLDLALTGISDGKEVFFGALHVKASFAERRTDDVPMSEALVGAGFLSPLWTMDCKATPSARPVNKGELGRVWDPSADRRSAKRKDIEDDGYFSACFSYNRNTAPTPNGQASIANVYIADFSNPDDVFTQFVRAEWSKFSS